MDLTRLSPYVRVALESVVPAPFYLERVIFDYELLYVKEGNVNVIVKGVKHEGKSGDLFLLKPMEEHIIVAESGFFRQYAVHFDLFQLDNSPVVKVSFKKFEDMSLRELGWFRPDDCSGPVFHLPNLLRLAQPQPVEKLLLALIREIGEKTPYSFVRLKGLFLELWSLILHGQLAAPAGRAFGHEAKLHEVKDYIEQNLDKTLSVADLARIARLSKYYFLRLFKELFGISPLKYQQLARVERARELLQFSGLTVQEIAYAVGYESIQAFSRAFSGVEGVPPSYYRGQRRFAPK